MSYSLFIDADADAGDRPKIDRGQLRQMLLDSLPPPLIHWDQTPSHILPQDDGTFELAFQDRASKRYDLVVGADGAWSRVRPLVSKAQPVYSGVSFFELGIDRIDTDHPELARLIGHGLMFALGDSKALIARRDANAHSSIYAGLGLPKDWTATGLLDPSSPHALRSSLAAHFDGWSENLLQLIRKAEVEITPRPISALPVGHRWTHCPGVTLIGDAAHLMSPFTGEGANLAMRDAADLALALVQEDDWRAAVQRFEEAMGTRAEVAAAEARDGIDGTFSKNGLAFMLGQMEGHCGSDSLDTPDKLKALAG